MSTLASGTGTLADYFEWFETAPHGAVLVYHEGDLQFDRQVELAPDSGAGRAAALDALARRVFFDAGEGALILTQRRMGPSTFAYRATRLRRPAEANYEVPVRNGEYHPA